MVEFQKFTCSWATSVKISTGIAGLCLVALLILGHLVGSLIIGSVLSLSALFWVRGYRLSPDALLIDFPFWSQRYSLADLASVELEARALEGSFKVLGSGLFSLVGRFHNARYGWFRSYATNPRCAVVLKTSTQTLVLTPDEPAEFGDACRAALALEGSAPGLPSREERSP